jgi:hypothetical protein
MESCVATSIDADPCRLKVHRKDQRAERVYDRWNLVSCCCRKLSKSSTSLLAAVLHFQCQLCQRVAAGFISTVDHENVGLFVGTRFLCSRMLYITISGLASAISSMWRQLMPAIVGVEFDGMADVENMYNSWNLVAIRCRRRARSTSGLASAIQYFPS